MKAVPTAQLFVGLHQGGQRPREGTHEVNIQRGGPAQLLAWIEIQLGINGPDIPWTDRVVQYHDRLAKSKGVFAASFKADPWATTSSLLRRRDAFLQAGWNPSQRLGIPIMD